MKYSLFENGRFLIPGSKLRDPTWLISGGGRILALGDGSPPAPPPWDLERVDLQGGTAIPGPVDGHCHLVSYGMQASREADLRGADSVAEIGRRLREHAGRLGIRAGDGRWLLGRGFEQDRLAEGRWPTRHDLDRCAPDVPVRITRVCGHALVASSAALKAAGLDPAVSGGEFPEGVLTETAMAPIYQAIPQPNDEDWRTAARWACREAARVGFVGVHSLMAHEREIRALVDLNRTEGLPVRVTMQIPYAQLDATAAAGYRTGFGDDVLAIGAVKLFSDGSLGARTAALRQPYSDAPDTSGELIYPPEELAARVSQVYAAGFQVAVHAIGDRAMDVTLDAIAHGMRHAPPGVEIPPARIEHASVVDSAILARMHDLGVGAAIQPQFAWSDYWAADRLGKRAAGCYAFRALHEAGIALAGSTDCPVERMDAMTAIGQLVHRPPWLPENGLALADALRIFSEGSHRLCGRPRGTGALAVGQAADFTVLAEDPRRCEPAHLERIAVRMTVMSGIVQYADSGD